MCSPTERSARPRHAMEKRRSYPPRAIEERKGSARPQRWTCFGVKQRGSWWCPQTQARNSMESLPAKVVHFRWHVQAMTYTRQKKMYPSIIRKAQLSAQSPQGSPQVPLFGSIPNMKPEVGTLFMPSPPYGRTALDGCNNRCSLVPWSIVQLQSKARFCSWPQTAFRT